MGQVHPPLSLPRHASLCLAVGPDSGDADLGPTRASHGHLSLEDAQGHFGQRRRVRVLWHRRDMGHSCLGLGFTS
ncbi:hypothetical protein SynRS9909_01379 [Synechococcus sp. RS9909]|uniref:hypothetical protein n=1 Tax=unclassified Synechococcus TaxID=2626047 RepID=UPI000068F843|nr:MULTISPECIES: hypothetical protein [unclassified Synechococcus]EAQ69378.1 hypothetical protein RS9917_13080 [Synechococcus sp. RS9917]QNI79366.1 hypothetical protein SynRS9909_01379 [Synechococcus sp. RS9909]